jgi:hypothetical protein
MITGNKSCLESCRKTQATIVNRKISSPILS